MNKDQLKQAAIKAIDEYKDKLFSIRESIYREPEYGYKEIETTKKVSAFLREELGLNVTEQIAVTGCRADLDTGTEGPCVAIMGELDAISCREHKDANELGASHTCGHYLQITGMLGAAIGLGKSGVLKELAGKIALIATPAEEFVELEYREHLKKEGKLTYFGGKQELIKNGCLDDVDMAMMFHSLDLGEKKALVGPESNGFIGKKIRFIGKESHAGSAPHEGINALNAAMLAINNVNALRETFPECERVRFHPIITKGGDIVNVVPADVTMEAYVRARSIQGIVDTNERVNRALRAGGDAVGARVEITEIPGYLPILRQPELEQFMKTNLDILGLGGQVVDGGDFTGSFDFGDISHIMPAIHPMFGGIRGALHTRDFEETDPILACIIPAKAMAMTVIDLLFDDAAGAKDLLKSYRPVMTKEAYLKLQESHDKTV